MMYNINLKDFNRIKPIIAIITIVYYCYYYCAICSFSQKCKKSVQAATNVEETTETTTFYRTDFELLLIQMMMQGIFHDFSLEVWIPC